MELTLHIDWLQDREPFHRIKSSDIKVTLPNQDMFYAFEAWMNLSQLSFDRYIDRCVDVTMSIAYDIVQEACQDVLGLSEKMYREGVFEIDDPIAHDENNASAIITIYVPKR